MTIEKILIGLDILVLQLANNEDGTTPPSGWAPEEWAYVKGISSAQIMMLRDRLIGRVREHLE